MPTVTDWGIVLGAQQFSNLKKSFTLAIARNSNNFTGCLARSVVGEISGQQYGRVVLIRVL